MTIRVRALKTGYYGNKRYQPGEEFDYDVDRFGAASWVERVDGKPMIARRTKIVDGRLVDDLTIREVRILLGEKRTSAIVKEIERARSGKAPKDDGEEETEEEDSLDDMTKEELKALLDDYEVEYSSTANKPELLELAKAAVEDPDSIV